jgi:hypothetical protein
MTTGLKYFPLEWLESQGVESKFILVWDLCKCLARGTFADIQH